MTNSLEQSAVASPITIGDVVKPLLVKRKLTKSHFAETIDMNIHTLNKILAQTFASDAFISQIAAALKVEPKLLESFKFSNIIINQIAEANEGTTIYQNATDGFAKNAELYERIIAEQRERILEKDELIKMLMTKIE